MIKRHITTQVKIGNVLIGGGAPIIVQSMTNTSSSDAKATAMQMIELYNAGSSIVRITINDENAMESIPKIKEILNKYNCNVPIVGDFHYNGHDLLSKYPESAKLIDKYRINPGNVGFGQKRDKQFEIIIKIAIKYDKPVRIGVNWGSLDKDLSAKLFDENNLLANPKSADEILREAIVLSALNSALFAEKIGLPKNKIILSCKVSKVLELVKIYQMLAERSSYALHLGLTEAGGGSKGIIASSAALSILLYEGIGDTIRTSITPSVNESRTKEVIVSQEILQSLGIRNFAPVITACPGCGRTTSSYFQELAEKLQIYVKDEMKNWSNNYIGVEDLTIAVMGCIVNGPGESKHANIGISLPGVGESPIVPVFIDGEKKFTLRGDDIFGQFRSIIDDYINKNYQLKS